MKRRAVLSVCVFIAASSAAFAKPDFSGRWKMDPGRSDYGQLPKPDYVLREIEHKDPDLAIKTTQRGSQGDIGTELKYTTDGKECVNQVRGTDVKGSAHWDGDNLVIEGRRKFQDAEIVTTDRWDLSSDGRTLTVTTRARTPQGEFQIKVIFDKQQ